MNKKGALTALVTIPIAVVFIILALALSPAVMQMVDDVRGQNTTLGGVNTGLNCADDQNTTIQATCTATDLFTPVFFGVLIGLAGVVIAARIIFTQ